MIAFSYERTRLNADEALGRKVTRDSVYKQIAMRIYDLRNGYVRHVTPAAIDGVRFNLRRKRTLRLTIPYKRDIKRTSSITKT